MKNSENKKNYQELIHSNEILTILFLICMEVISDVEANVIKAENEEKLINKKYMNKEDFINIKFWFEDKCSRLFKKDIDMSYYTKLAWDARAAINEYGDVNWFIPDDDSIRLPW